MTLNQRIQSPWIFTSLYKTPDDFPLLYSSAEDLFTREPKMFSSSSLHSVLDMMSPGDLFFSEQQLQVVCEVILDQSGDEVNPDMFYLDTEYSSHEDECFKLESCLDSSQNSSSTESDQGEGMSEDNFSTSEYVEDIYWNLRTTEERFRPKTGHMDHLPQIFKDLRPVTVDWLNRISTNLKLDTETLHLAVNYLDRIFSKTRSMDVQDLTLIGMTALFIAAKHQSRKPPKARMFVPGDGSYTKKDLIEMEWRLLRTLDMTLSAPTSNNFLHMYTSIYPVSEATQYLAVFLADLSLMNVDLLVRHDSSKVAAAAFFMANYRVNRENWPEDLEHFSGYSLDDMAECVDSMYKMELVNSELPLQATKTKYIQSMSLIRCGSPGSTCCCVPNYSSVFW